MMLPETRYAKSGKIHIAYQVFGKGPIDIVLIPGFVSHIENYWDEPNFARWLHRLGSFSRVVMFDKRGTGLSDAVTDLPSMDERMDDVRAVLDAVNIETATLFGISEGGSLAALFAGTHPKRCQALVLYGSFPRFSFWIRDDQALKDLLEYIDRDWGTGKNLPMFAPSRQDDAVFQRWWGRFERLGASPASVISLMQMNSQIDIADILPSIHIPTLVIHRTGDVTVDVEGGRFLAKHIPNARYVELPGADHLPFIGQNSDQIVDLIEEFLTGSKPRDETDRVLATILFTDIVGSTKQAENLGDRRWRDLLSAHDTAVRREIRLFHGTEIKSLGDGFLITFDGPARAIRCAFAIGLAVGALGMEIRMGLHTGEVELRDGDVSGIAVHIASRIASVAGPNQILVSRTVKDLVAGSGIRFAERGIEKLAGLREPMEVYVAME
jgi:pimeloyl-ACP methyl ester carboxylesterase/class 3 adenylate cyclase